MSPESQRIAIAEACGVANRWVLMKRGLYYRPNACGYTDNTRDAWIVSEEEADSRVYPHDEPVTKHRAPLPDYLGDLNAMAKAEKVLPDEHEYERLLKWVCDHDWQHASTPMKRNPIYASAAQRAEAFLRAISKWKETA